MCAKRNFNSSYISHCFLKINSDNCVFRISSDNYLHINSLLLIAVIILHHENSPLFLSPLGTNMRFASSSLVPMKKAVWTSCTVHVTLVYYLTFFGYTQEKNGWFIVYVWQIIILFIIIYSHLSLPPAVWLAGLSSGKCIYLIFWSIKGEQNDYFHSKLKP